MSITAICMEKESLNMIFLNDNSLKNITWNKLEYSEPNYFFVPKDFDDRKKYEEGFKIDDLFSVKAAGIKTHRDKVVIAFNKYELEKQINFFNAGIIFEENKIKNICYRPFDNRIVYFDTALIERHRKEQMMHSFYDNFALLSGRQTKNIGQTHFFITNYISEMKTSESSTGSYHFPLYLYPDENSLTTERTPNLNLEIVNEIEERLGLTFVNEKTEAKESFAPIDILDYIYAVLHSPSYREKYKEFLKIDFPRVPYPQAETFWELVKLGSELRSYHLLENPKVYEIVIALNESENNIIERKITKKDAEIEGDFVKLWLNDKQYIDKIPLVAWEFYIGGYQPAQKWLKDRAGREMREEDYEHYNKIIVALTKTNEIMQLIDEVFEV
ncbi:MAG: type ISP restriction/modification enzyme [Sulfurimonas sp.]|uniref:type ISP restriction/modification enzyme n=1 Tax=Sulfurimonas sp. TaxID=2022749 RepID=UPI003D0AB243